MMERRLTLASLSDRIDRLETQLQALEKKAWIMIVLFLGLGLNEGKGAFTGILTGNASLEVSNGMAEATLLIGLAAAAGSAFRAYLGFVGKKKQGAIFDWTAFLISVLPAVAAGFGAGALLDIEASWTNMMLIFFGAAGLNSLQDKFGLQKKAR